MYPVEVFGEMSMIYRVKHQGSGNNSRASTAGGHGLPQQQAGMTTIGFLILAVFIGLFAFAFIRLTPVYLNYMKVASVLDGAYKEFDGQNASQSALRKYIVRRFSVESVSQITASDINIKLDGNSYRVEAVYDHKAPFIGNVSFAVHFDKEVQVRK